MKKVSGPLFKWFGSKWRAAARYPTVPTGEAIFEPFAGGAGLALQYADHPVQIYDCNPALKILWPWLIGPATGDDIMQIPCDLEVGQDIRELDLTVPQALLLKQWQRFGRYSNSGPMWKVSNCDGEPGQWTPRLRDRVAREIEYVKHWIFAPIDYTEVGYYFIDPPYQFNVYDYGTPINYGRLVADFVEVPDGSRLVVCEGVGSKGEIPDWLTFEKSHTAVTSRRTYSDELIFVYGFGDDWRKNLGPPR